ncbi:MAG: response regulator [Methyloglobulus sp.]|nr:hypothetical protein [Methyloglobulus sp.]
MLTTTYKHQPFVTLIAHQPCDALNRLKLTTLFNNVCVLTQTVDETAITITNQAFGLMIIDLNINGAELISIARKPDCINFATPAIALTDNNDTTAHKNLIAAGFDECLPKPLTSTIIKETIGFWHDDDNPLSHLNAIDTLLAKCKYNHGLVLKICHQLFEDLPLQITEIEEALQQGTYKNAFEATHKINGSVKICCLNKIGELADSLERSIIEKNTHDADLYFLALKHRIIVFLKHRETIFEHLYKASSNVKQ